MNDPRVNETIAEWLFENGSPGIRYRITRESGVTATGTDIESLRCNLLNDGGTKRWLDCLRPFEYMAEQQRLGQGLGQGGHSSFLHGSKNMNFEVVMPKLAQLGLHAGIPELDERTVSWRNYLAKHLENTYDDPFSDDAELQRTIYAFHDRRLIIAFSLTRAGYANDPSVSAVIRSRLEAISETVSRGIVDIYENPDDITVRPVKWRSHIVKRELYPDGNIRLPFIHDIWNFAAIYAESDRETRLKIDDVIDWTLSAGYTEPGAYAYLRYPSGRGKHVGDNLYYPGFGGAPLRGFEAKCLVQRCWQMAHFPTVIRHDWFSTSMRLLETFATGNGQYRFPPEYLTEIADGGKWVYGMHMGLGANRRSRTWREIESTFWMDLIKKRVRDTEKLMRRS